MWFAGSVWQVTEADCQNFEGNSHVLSGHLFAIQHFWPLLTDNVHSDGSCTSLPFKHLLFPFQGHEAKFLEKLTGARKVKKFPNSCGTKMFVTMFTRVCYVSLSEVWWVQSTSFRSYFFMMHFSIIFPLIPRSSRWTLSTWFPTKILFPLPIWGSASFSRTLFDWVNEWVSELVS